MAAIDIATGVRSESNRVRAEREEGKCTPPTGGNTEPQGKKAGIIVVCINTNAVTENLC